LFVVRLCATVCAAPLEFIMLVLNTLIATLLLVNLQPFNC